MACWPGRPTVIVSVSMERSTAHLEDGETSEDEKRPDIGGVAWRGSHVARFVSNKPKSRALVLFVPGAESHMFRSRDQPKLFLCACFFLCPGAVCAESWLVVGGEFVGVTHAEVMAVSMGLGLET